MDDDRRPNDGLAWDFGWYEPQDKAGILALNRDEYPGTALCEEDYFDWLVERNPMGRSIVPVARDRATGLVVGFAMYTPMRMRRDGREVPALVGINTLVSPPYRRQGIHSHMMASAQEEGRRRHVAFFYVFPNARSLPSLIQSQHHIVARVPLMVRPLDIAALAEERIDSGPLRVALSAAWMVAAGTFCRPHGAARLGHGLHIVEDACFDEGYDHFWPRVKDKYGVMLVRDRAYLQWRFRDLPHRQYRVLSARSGSEVMGYIVLRDADVRGTRVGLIADLLVLPGDAGTRAGLCLVGEALRLFRDAGVPLSGGLMLPHTHEYAILRRGGLLPAPQALAPQQFHLVVKGLSDGFLPDDLARAREWFVTAADHDAI